MKVLISVHDPAQARGGLCMTLQAVDCVREIGYEPTLFYLDGRNTRWRPSGISEGVLDAERLWDLGHAYKGRPMRCIMSTAWPLRGAANYLPLTGRFRRICADHDHFLGVGGTATMAYPFWRAGLPYSLRIATTLSDEWRGRPHPPLARVLRPFSYSVERRILASARSIMALSAPTQRLVREMGLGPLPDSVVGYGVDPEAFPETTRDGRPPETMVLSADISDPRKNVGLLFEVLAEVFRRTGRGRLILLSTTGPTDRMLRRCRDLGIADRVEHRPLRSPSDKLRAYADADIAVTASHQEGLGIALMEGMSTGLPAVSTRCGGPESFVEHGVNGLLVDLDDPSGFADAVVDLMEHADLLTRLGRAAAAKSRRDHAETRATLRSTFQRALEPAS